MEIYTIFGSSQKTFKKVSEEYDNQVSSGILSPSLVATIQPRNFPENRTYLTARELDGTFKGVLSYEACHPRTREDLWLELMEKTNDTDLKLKRHNGFQPLTDGKMGRFEKYSYKAPLVYVHWVESFQRGVGTKLIETLKEQIKSEGIFLRAIAPAKEFYTGRKFTESGVRTSSNNSIMIWMNQNLLN